jgi:hypothetical protein
MEGHCSDPSKLPLEALAVPDDHGLTRLPIARFAAAQQSIGGGT